MGLNWLLIIKGEMVALGGWVDGASPEPCWGGSDYVSLSKFLHVRENDLLVCLVEFDVV